MDYHVVNVDRLQLCVGHPGDVSKLEEFFNCREHDRDQVTRVVIRLLDNNLPFQKLMRNQLKVVVLKVCKYTCHGVVDQVRGHVAVIH